MRDAGKKGQLCTEESTRITTLAGNSTANFCHFLILGLYESFFEKLSKKMFFLLHGSLVWRSDAVYHIV